MIWLRRAHSAQSDFPITLQCAGRDYVIKQVDISRCDKKERESARKECAILGALKHPNIIEYRESFEEKGQVHADFGYSSCDLSLYYQGNPNVMQSFSSAL